MYTALKSSKKKEKRKKRKIQKYEGGEPFFFFSFCNGHSRIYKMESVNKRHFLRDDL